MVAPVAPSTEQNAPGVTIVAPGDAGGAGEAAGDFGAADAGVLAGKGVLVGTGVRVAAGSFVGAIVRVGAGVRDAVGIDGVCVTAAGAGAAGLGTVQPRMPRQNRARTRGRMA